MKSISVLVALAAMTGGCPGPVVYADVQAETTGDAGPPPQTCGATIPTCDPVLNAGCASGGCYPAAGDAGQLVGVCYTVSGTEPTTGLACGTNAICTPTDLCDHGMCRPLCCVGADGDTFCRLTTGNPRSSCPPVSAALGACTLPATCDLAAQNDCPGTSTCRLRNDAVGITECFPSGTIANGDVCDATSLAVPQCRQGSKCVSFAGVGHCVRVCNNNLAVTGCTSGTCHPNNAYEGYCM